MAPLLPPAALALAVPIGNASESFDNEYAWMNYAGGLLLAELFMAVGIVQRRRRTCG